MRRRVSSVRGFSNDYSDNYNDDANQSFEPVFLDILNESNDLPDGRQYSVAPHDSSLCVFLPHWCTAYDRELPVLDVGDQEMRKEGEKGADDLPSGDQDRKRRNSGSDEESKENQTETARPAKKTKRNKRTSTLALDNVRY